MGVALLPSDWKAIVSSLSILAVSFLLWGWWLLSAREAIFATVLSYLTLTGVILAIGGIGAWVRSLLIARNRLMELEGRGKIADLQRQFDDLFRKD
jgi:hypothetical protein